jgi:hypothetical protein
MSAPIQRTPNSPQNLEELLRWREVKAAHTCDDHYLRQLDRKWRSIGRQARQPASLRGGRPY